MLRSRLCLLFLVIALGPAVAQRPLITSHDLTALLPHLRFEGRPVANAEALAIKLAPMRTKLATLSRDGRHLAYTVTDGPYTRIDIRSIDHPSEVHDVQLGDMATAEIIALEWTSPERLVIATEDWVIGAVELGQDRVRSLITPRSFKVRIGGRALITRRREEDPYQTYEMDRPARLLNLDSQLPDHVIIEGVAGDSIRNAFLVTARLDLASGEWKYLDEVRITTPAMRTISDRTGRIRLQEDRTTLPFQWQIRVLDAEGRPQRWRDLEDVIAPEIAATFEAPPDQLWSRRSIPLGFAADPNLLYYTSNAASDTFGVYALDLTTGQRTDFAITSNALDLVDPAAEISPRAIGRTERFVRAENAAVYYTDFRPRLPPSPLVLDRATHAVVGVRTQDFESGVQWLDDALASVQNEINTQFRGRHATILNWDDARTRYLVHVESRSDPGRYFIYDRADQRWIEQLRQAPRLEPGTLHPTIAFATQAPDGRRITGQLTSPRTPLLKKPPLLVMFADGPWQTAPQGFSGPVQMLAEFGCAVLQLNYRGTAGLGRELLLGAREAPDQATASDVAAALDELAQSHPFDRKRVATIGVGYGGWLALRTAQLLPDRIRCVVSLNGFNNIDRLLEAPPPRELPEGRNRNLELVENAVNYLDQANSTLSSFAKSAEESDPRNLPDGTVEEEDDTEVNLFTPEGRASTRLQSFDRDAASNAESEGAMWEDVYWANKARLDAMLVMQDAIEVTPVHPRSVFARWYFEPLIDHRESLSVLNHIDDLKAEVFIGQEIHNPHAPTADATALRRALDAARNPPDYWEISAHAWSRPIDQQPEVWLQVARFFNENLYNFDVQVGTAVEVKEDTR
ncbi:alpha/beta hydrolase family protein [Synoicihabitans lomoniglobus]|uniref:Alpha/beta fold hydrolase n=1 Tax=Synoicihabitans lomoniglobus TaxID=2909285 RepID=A0AAF0CPR6_9BACT|nr:alpha/beta fold hydrolase [Opitutaceae bacterium LMO-M01]WED65800.1 alpha/beta fold hydrolase [Opitutaceae bacterium LMO-M01]